MTITFEGPALMVRDMKACRAFYEDVLGQKVLFAVGEAYTAYTGKFSLWEAGGAHQTIFGHGTPPAPQDPDAVLELYFESAEIEAALERVTRAGVDLVHGLREQPWGQRCFRARDPEGRIVEVGEPMPVVARRLLDEGLGVDEVARRTMLPVEMVAAIKAG